jgi:hypothetical protein
MKGKCIHQRIVRENIQRIGEESFPDDEVRWQMITITNKGEYCFIESDAWPRYDKFIFVLIFTDDHSYKMAGCYCWDDNQWGLLFTNPDEKEDWMEIFNRL